MIKVETYKIGEENVNCRIDKVIPILNDNITRMVTQKLLEEEKILVNGRKIKASYKVKLNDDDNSYCSIDFNVTAQVQENPEKVLMTEAVCK